MNFIKILKVIFKARTDSELSVDERYSTIEASYLLDSLDCVTSVNIQTLKGNIVSRDTAILSITVGEENPIILNFSNNEFNTFIEKIEEARKYLENENITFNLRINKNTQNGIISIYNLESFEKFVKDIKVIPFLSTIKDDLLNNESLQFIVYEDGFESFYSERVIFHSSDEKPEITKTNFPFAKFKESCNFGNIVDFPFNPFCFNLLVRPERKNSITEKLDLLANLFNIISIFDITLFQKDDFYYKLNGYKVFEGRINFDTFFLHSQQTYNNIISWIYSESGNISDKIGLTRNILSIYLRDESLEIEENAYHSIQSGYKTYLQENLNRYIEIRNKISDQLIGLVRNSKEISEQYLKNYQKSNFTFISFFVSVFILRVLTRGNFENVFTRDATIISLALILLSVVFLVFSLWNFNLEVKRLKEKYEILKGRFEDLLMEKDISKILRDDREFNDEIAFLVYREKMFTALWIISVLVFLVAIFTLSDFINWNTIFWW